MSKEGYKVQTEQYSHLFHILINFKIRIINLSLVSSKINRNTSVTKLILRVPQYTRKHTLVFQLVLKHVSSSTELFLCTPKTWKAHATSLK